MELLGPQEEKRILGAVENVISLVNGGMAPTDALHKVAEAEKLTPPIIQRMAEAFNVSKFHSHLRHAKGAERAASFPLADPADVICRMFPPAPTTEAVKAASVYVPEELMRPEKVNFNKPLEPLGIAKAAEALPRDAEAEARRQYGMRSKLAKQAELATRDMNCAGHKVLLLAKAAAEHFHLLKHVPFAQVEQDIVALHEGLGKSACDLIYAEGQLREKRAEIDKDHQPIFDEKAEPWAGILKVVDCSLEIADAIEKVASANIALQLCEDGLAVPRPAAAPARLFDALADGREEKRAVETPPVPFLAPQIPDALKNIGYTGMSLAGLKPKDYDKVKQQVTQEVMNPVHEAKLQGIKMKAVLNDMVSNDPILSAHDPQAVYAAYNQIAELAPTTLQQPSVLRGVLRRMMQQEGVLEPFEAQQLTAIEKNLRGLPSEPTGMTGPAKHV